MSAAKGCLRALTGLLLLAVLGFCAFTLWSSPSQDSPPPTATATTVRLWPQQATATPQPTPMDPDTYQYLGDIHVHVGAITDAIGASIDLWRQPKITDLGWQKQIDAQVTIIMLAQSLLNDVQPPPRWAQQHDKLLQAVAACVTTVDLARAGLLAADVTWQTQIEQPLDECSSGVTEVNEALLADR